MLKVKKVSYNTLKSTIRDISAVTTLTDRIGGHFLNGDPTKVIFHDLADEIKGGIPSFEHETGLDSRMKRKLDAEVLNDSITEMEFYESGRMKRLKEEVPLNTFMNLYIARRHISSTYAR